MFTFRHDPIHQAMLSHLLCADLSACQHQLHCAVLAEGACQPLRATCRRNNAKQDLRLSKACSLRCYDHVAMHRQFAAAADSIATHRRDHRLMDALNAQPALETTAYLRRRM